MFDAKVSNFGVRDLWGGLELQKFHDALLLEKRVKLEEEEEEEVREKGVKNNGLALER